MRLRAALLVVLAVTTAPLGAGRGVLESTFSAHEVEPAADPDDPFWTVAPRVRASRDRMGNPVAGPPTEIRSRWTREHLYLLFICPYTELNASAAPLRDRETPRLWLRDVVEAFIGLSQGPITRYREFQASPVGEWADLDIDRENPDGQRGMAWDSGFRVTARIDPAAKTWYAVMQIPFAALDAESPAPGDVLRLGLFRIAGATEPRTRYVWQPTGRPTFHVPEAFGILRLQMSR